MDEIIDTDQQVVEDYNIRINNENLKRVAAKEELRFLSIIVKDRESLMEAMSFGFKPGNNGHFWSQDGRTLFGLIYAYYQKYNKILTRGAIDSIMDTMDNFGGRVVDEEDKTAIRLLWDKVYSLESSADDYELLRDNINNRFVQWQAHVIMRDGYAQIARATSGQVEIVKTIREKMIKLDYLDADPYALTMSINQGLDKVSEMLATRRNNPNTQDVILTGLNGLDRILHGLERGTYTVVTGMINGGKTTLMFNIAFNMAKAGYNVVYVSLEKKAVSLYSRLVALHALVDYNRIKVGGTSEHGLSDYYFNKLNEAIHDLKSNVHPNFDIIQLAQGVKLSKIISEIEKIKASKKVDAIFVDYLGAIGMETVTPGRPDLDEHKVSQRLQAYGRINNFVTVTAAQLKTPSSKEIRGKSRKAGTADDASTVEVNTEDVAGSKMIIADADNAWGCILNSDHPATKMFVYITKARDDESRVQTCFDFDGKLGRVSDQEFIGRVEEVDKLLYNKNITAEKLESDDGLFNNATGIEAMLQDGAQDDVFDDGKVLDAVVVPVAKAVVKPLAKAVEQSTLKPAETKDEIPKPLPAKSKDSDVLFDNW